MFCTLKMETLNCVYQLDDGGKRGGEVSGQGSVGAFIIYYRL